MYPGKTNLFPKDPFEKHKQRLLVEVLCNKVHIHSYPLLIECFFRFRGSPGSYRVLEQKLILNSMPCHLCHKLIYYFLVDKIQANYLILCIAAHICLLQIYTGWWWCQRGTIQATGCVRKRTQWEEYKIYWRWALFNYFDSDRFKYIACSSNARGNW